MTPERWQQIRAVYAEADDAAPAERAAVLDRLCSGDPALRLAVEKLFADDRGDALLREVVDEAADRLGESLGDLTGRTIGSYQPIRMIGKGGMGEVYLAEDARLGRRVALKLLPALHRQDSGRIRRFQQEARAVSALNHPNIITVYDFGQTEGVFYIATELVEGKTLRQILADRRLPVTDSLAIAIQVAKALSAAHEAGIVHRDVKPENIMVRQDGYVKVLDFGLAKLREAGSSEAPPDSRLTLSGAVMGTTSYMSPEQARGTPLDARSDIFSLGVVLYEMIAGRPPFHGASGADILAAILDRDPPPLPASPGPGFPRLNVVVSRCLCKDRGERYRSSEELVEQLGELKQKLDLSSGSASRPVVDRRRARERLALAVCAIALAAALSYVFLSWVRTGDSNRYQRTRITRIPVEGEGNCGVISPTGRYMACQSILPDTSRTISVRLFTTANGVEVVPPSLSAYYAVLFSPDENYLYYTVHRIGGGDPGALFRVPVLGGSAQKLLENIGNFAFSPDGSKLAFLREEPAGAVMVADLDGSNTRELFRKPGITNVVWASDGRAILYLDTVQRPAGRFWRIVARESNGNIRPMADLDGLIPISFTPLPDSNAFLLMAYDPDTHQPQIWYQPQNRPARQITHDLNEYHGLSVTRDGRRILTGQASRDSQLWRVATNDPESSQLIADFGRQLSDPVWLPRGGIVARSGVTSGGLRVIAADGSGERSLLWDGSLRGSELSACPDRPDVVFVSASNGYYNLWRALPEAHEARQLTFGGNDRTPQCIAGGTVVYNSGPAGTHVMLQVPLDGGAPTASKKLSWGQQLSPDGAYTALHLIDDRTHADSIAIRTLDGSRTVLAFPSVGDYLAWAPDSRGVAYLDRVDGSMEVWYRPLDGHAARRLTHLGMGIFSFAWSPDGRYLICAAGRISTAPMTIEDLR